MIGCPDFNIDTGKCESPTKRYLICKSCSQRSENPDRESDSVTLKERIG